MGVEVWVSVVGFEGRYEVSSWGRIRNMRGRFLRAQKTNSGYLVVHLYSGRKNSRQICLVHRAVARAFVPNRSALPEVNHVDADKTNNHARNLQWVSRQGNVDHAVRLGLNVQKPNARQVRGTPLRDGEPVTFPSQKDAEIALAGRPTSAISNCLRGRAKSAYGYRWSAT